jgi:hypothetical protein
MSVDDQLRLFFGLAVLFLALAGLAMGEDSYGQFGEVV